MAKKHLDSNLVGNIKIDKPSGTAVVTVRTHSGKNISFKVRTEANVKAAIAGFEKPRSTDG